MVRLVGPVQNWSGLVEMNEGFPVCMYMGGRERENVEWEWNG